MTEPIVSDHGLDHFALAARTRRFGAVQFLDYRLRAERPFLITFLTTALGNPLLYLAAMGLGLGAVVQRPVGGVPYLLFVAPGLLISTVVTTAANWGTWPIFSGFKWEKTYFSAGASPLGARQLVLGETLGMVVRLLLQGLIFWLIGLAFGAWGSPASVLAVPIGIVAGLAMFTPLMAYSATLESEGLQFNFITRLIVMPMFLFAGTFFPLEAMPVYLRWIGWVSPMWHGTQLSRVASFGLDVPGWLIGVHVAFLVGCAAAGLWCADRTFARRLVK
ncbi:ABC transporter permease [Nigerium massiliense]|uniref:ABC transporter permease n=1 Tax=Nigerium massiliense TaxID=1522317 RepID=UPI00069377BE|nr:ABC transporter permease [Nigerium massiliense]